MATTRIGPQIGIEGEKEYRNTIKTLVSVTKEWEAEVKLLNATFEKNENYLEANKSLQNALKGQMDSLSQVIKTQKDRLAELTEQHVKLLSEGGEGVKGFDEKYAKLSETIKLNETQFAQLEQQLNQTKIEEEEFVAVTNTLGDAFDNVDTESLKIDLQELGQTLSDIGSTLTRTVSTPIFKAAKSSIDAAIDWETAFTGVKKTTEATEEEYAAIEKDLLGIGTRTASTYDEIAAVAEVAGQLGVDKEYLADFTEAMIQLGDSTNLSAEEAATNIARILNITQSGVFDTKDIRNFGSAIVHLGNNYATTESEIALMANRLAAGGKMANLTTADILGLATAMSSVGIRAEAGGTAMTQTLTAIEKAVSGVGDNASAKLQKMAQISGMTTEEFSNAWKNEPKEALVAFLSGLGDLEDKGESATLILDELEMSGIRQSNMLKSLALASDILTQAIDSSNEAWYGTRDYLDEEAQLRYGTVAAKVTEMKNAWEKFSITVGEKLMPHFEKVTEWLTKAAEWLDELDPKWVDFGLSIAGVVATIGPLLAISGSVLKFFAGLKTSMAILGAAEGVGSLVTVATGIGGVTSAIGGVAGAGGLIGALSTLIPVIGGGIAAFGLMKALSNLAIADMGKDVESYGKKVNDMVENNIGKWETEIYDENGILIRTFEYYNDALDNYLYQAEERQNKYLSETKLTGIQVAAEYDDLGNELIAIGEKTTPKVEGGMNKQFQVIDTSVKGIKTSVASDFDLMQQNMINAINSNKENLKITMNSTMESMKNPILSAKNDAYSWGADIASNMSNGIEGKKWSLIEKVRGLASSIRSYLHFSEPDVGPLSDFHTYMPDMMKLMAKGINDNAYLVENAVDGVAQSMVLGGGALPLGSTAQSFNYGGININLNVSDSATGSRIINEIETELARRMNNRKAVFSQ